MIEILRGSLEKKKRKKSQVKKKYEIGRGRVFTYSYLGEGDVQGQIEGEDNSGNQYNENSECRVFKIYGTCKKQNLRIGPLAYSVHALS